MTREEAKTNLNMIRVAFGVPVTKEQKELIEETFEMAIQALSQEPTDDATLKDIFCMGCEYKEQEPRDDTVSIRKDVLKCRVGELVAYNVEWLKKHWQMEMDIVCGVKPCDDAISRQAVLGETIRKNSIWNSITNSEGKNLEEIIFELPSVTKKSGKWITDEPTVLEPYVCSECGIFHNGKYKNYCPNCGADMREEQTE